jgi:hypothetical protein
MAMRSDPSKNVSLKYDTPQPDVLTLEGPFLGDTISVRLRKTPPPTFFLTTRGFHWINEYPLNR